MAETKRSGKYIFFLILFMGLVGQMDVWLSLIESYAAPFILAEAGLAATPWLFGFWQGVFGVVVFLVFFIGWFSDSFGRKYGILALVLVMGIPAGLILVVPSIATQINFFLFLLLYSIVIMGTTSNLWEVPITEESPAKRRGLYNSIAFLISVIPLYALLGSALMDALGWRWGYGVMAILAIILFVFWFFMKETTRWTEAHEKREKRLGIIEALRSLGRRDILYVGIASLVYLMWTISFKLGTTWSGVFFTSILADPTQWRTILTIGGLMLPISALISGVLLERVGRNFTLVLGTLGAIISFAGLGLTFMPAFFWGVYFFMAMVLAWIYTYVTEIFPTKVRSSSIGIAVTASRLGYIIAPLIAAALLLFLGLPATTSNWLFFWVIAGLFMIFPLLSFLTKPYETKGKELETIDEEK